MSATDRVAVAVPPTAPAGAWLVIAIPAAGGVTVALKPVTVPSASEAVMLLVAASPWSVVRAPPHVTLTGWFGGGPPQSTGDDAVLRGVGAPVVEKSVELLSVSVQPLSSRSAATVAEIVPVGPVPSKQVVPVP